MRSTHVFEVKSLSHVWLFVTPWAVACTRLLRPWDFLGKSTGVGRHFLLQGIFPTQGSNPGLPHCRQTLYHLSHQGSPTHVFTKVISSQYSFLGCSTGWFHFNNRSFKQILAEEPLSAQVLWNVQGSSFQGPGGFQAHQDHLCISGNAQQGWIPLLCHWHTGSSTVDQGTRTRAPEYRSLAPCSSLLDDSIILRAFFFF